MAETEGGQGTQGKAPERVKLCLRLAGGAIGVVQGIVIPLQGSEPSLPVIAMALGMMGIAEAIKIDRRKGGE
jgi:hypothetical protein